MGGCLLKSLHTMHAPFLSPVSLEINQTEKAGEIQTFSHHWGDTAHTHKESPNALPACCTHTQASSLPTLPVAPCLQLPGPLCITMIILHQTGRRGSQALYVSCMPSICGRFTTTFCWRKTCLKLFHERRQWLPSGWWIPTCPTYPISLPMLFHSLLLSLSPPSLSEREPCQLLQRCA